MQTERRTDREQLAIALCERWLKVVRGKQRFDEFHDGTAFANLDLLPKRVTDTRFAQQGCSTQRLDKGSDSAAEHLETLVGGVGIRGVSRHCGLNHGEPLLK
ncbi:MAG: hypothetical protein IPK39_02790 [Sulfuritalea sp.]|nr:hypothetical protein [Sulfuritalea sp.]